MDVEAVDGTGEMGDRANELYWNSSESVNRIADALELSKGSLYDLVRPHPAGLPCPECAAELEYPNRTARDRGLLACPSCGLEEDEDEVRAEWRDAADEAPGSGALVVSPGSGVTARNGGVRPAPAQAPPDRAEADGNRALAGLALLGVAAGVALAMWARKR